MKRTLIVLLFVAGICTTAAAVDITLSNNTSIKGMHTSPSIMIPAGVYGPATIVVNATLSDLQDATKSIIFDIELSDDNGVTWRPYAGFTYVGGVYTSPDGNLSPPPGVGFMLEELAGKRVHFIANIPVRMSLGATLHY